MQGNALVSVIIPTRNSAQYLRRCVESIRAQTYRPIEIIVVDNASDDGTRELASAIADRVLTGGPERCAQCNAGARAARGDYFYRVDADFVLDPEVVAEGVAACRGGLDAACVPNRSDPSVSFWSRVRHFERLMYDGSPVFSGARFFTRHAFDAIGGFDETLVAGDDYDVNNRLAAAGLTVGWIHAAELHLGEPATLGDVARKSFYYGSVFGPFLRKSGARGIAQINPFRATYARHWRDFLKHPVLGAGFALMQMVKYASGAAGLATATLRRRPTA
ncbi:MAG TPA: glycosyltransferase [Candidatus Eremiobacteraceae bacterium]|nr:glycosyltransferase [Candidatus Eremiobacteraceae bacterium]